jgi:hypothetical protein
MTTSSVDTPSVITRALAQMERMERISKVTSYVLLALIVILPFLISFRPAGMSVYDAVVLVLASYNLLFVVWIKQDIHANTARIARILTAMRRDTHSQPTGTTDRA